ncbi:MAG: tRNA glutamyl-Q(34) synthetase GluQRS [Acetobacter sp.]|uniref:tRNA glutamyl-Q(34) synthetase GluQRS n=1 Tax=Acetobacter sp. TaxID=440 RepID=UPI0039E91984
MKFSLHSSVLPAHAWRTRFAPSPTGLLHLGHVASAFHGWAYSRPDGAWLLRLEDIDPQRCKPEFGQAILDDLAWLGLVPDGPVLRQSENMPAYRRTLDRLAGLGVVYPCFCTRADIARESAAMFSAPHTAPDGALLYPGRCRTLPDAQRRERLAQGQPYVLRLDMARALEHVRQSQSQSQSQSQRQSHNCGQGTGGAWALAYRDLDRGTVACRPELFGDVVLARRDVPVSYHLCVTHDDAAQGITLVTRGEDLRPATDLHRLLQALMGWPVPAYAFHPLLCDGTGRRLAKRDGALAVRAMREAGLAPADVRRRAGVPDMPDMP